VCESSSRLLRKSMIRKYSGTIPPTQLVVRSYSAYKRDCHALIRNPTNAVGGSFILDLQQRQPLPHPESHQRSWWIVHTQPTKQQPHASPNPPTASPEFGKQAGAPLCRLSMNDPPTALVGFGRAAALQALVG
jgi:hypothetical protein